MSESNGTGSDRPPGTLRLGLAVGGFIVSVVVGCIIFIYAGRPEPRVPGPVVAPPRLRVLAAASLAEPLRAIAGTADRARVELELAATNALERQIASGAEVDVFIAAAAEPVDRLIAQNLLDPETRRTICENSLVVVAASSAPKPADVAALVSCERIAVGAKGVPAGDYAREALEHAGLLAQVEGKLASYPDEPSVLAAVRSGGAPVGFVYASSVHALPEGPVALAFTVDPKLHARIVYVAAVGRSSKEPRLARELVDGFRSGAWGKVLREAGFLLPRAP